MRGNSAFQLFNREFIAFQEVKKISLFLADLLGPFPDILSNFDGDGDQAALVAVQKVTRANR